MLSGIVEVVLVSPGTPTPSLDPPQAVWATEACTEACVETYHCCLHITQNLSITVLFQESVSGPRSVVDKRAISDGALSALTNKA